MWATRLLAATLFACSVYLGGSLLASEYSTQARAEARAHTARLEEHIGDLRALNARLISEAELLQRSSDRIALEARTLGYYRDGDGVIRLDGESRVDEQNPGSTLFRPPTSDHNTLYVRVAAVLAFLVALLFQSLVAAEAGDRGYEMRRASK